MPDANCELLLCNGAKFRDFQIPLHIFHGELQANQDLKSDLVAEAMGGIWFIEEQNFVHGWLYFKSNNFTALWDQVRDGGYIGCKIHLGVEPVQDGIRMGNPPINRQCIY